MTKKAALDVASFVDQHPTTAVADLLGIMNDSAALSSVANRDVVTAYLLRLADCEGVPDPIRSIARPIARGARWRPIITERRTKARSTP